MDLKGKKIIVTGGNSGIGKSTAEQLVKKGARVLITGRNEQKTKEVAMKIGAIPFNFDISDLDAINENAIKSLEKLGGVNALINNAGIGVFNELGEISMQDFEKVFNTNVFGLALYTQALLPTFKSQKHGTIINIGSSAAVKGFKNGTVYSASKFAVRSMTQSWQAELRLDNIRVCLVNPSEVTTAFNQKNRQEREEENNKLRPDEIAHTIVSVLEMDDRGFVPEIGIWATNPF